MKKTLTIIKREFMTKLFNKGFLISTLLGPIFIMGIYFIPSYFRGQSAEEQMVVQVVDYSQSLGNELPKMFGDTNADGQARFIVSPLSPESYEADQETFYQAVEENYVDAILILPADLSSGEMTYISAEGRQSISSRIFIERIRATINQQRLTNAGLDPGEVSRLTAPLALKAIKLSGGEASADSGTNPVVTIIFLTILYMTILIYGASVMQGVVEEKTSRIMEVLLSSGNSFQLMMGKLFGVGGIGLTQYLIWSAAALIAFQFAGSGDHFLASANVTASTLFFFILFFLLGYFQFSTLYAAVGAMCTTQEDVQSMSTPVTLFIILPFLITISLEPTSNLAQILSMMPLFAPMQMFLRIQQANPAVWEILLSIGINVLAILFFTWIAAKIYRVGSLMYGKRPTLGEVLRWVRY